MGTFRRAACVHQMGATGTHIGSKSVGRRVEMASGQRSCQSARRQPSKDKVTVSISGAAGTCDRRLEVYEKLGRNRLGETRNSDPSRTLQRQLSRFLARVQASADCRFKQKQRNG